MARVLITLSADADTAKILEFLAINGGFRVAAKYDAFFEALYVRWAALP